MTRRKAHAITYSTYPVRVDHLRISDVIADEALEIHGRIVHVEDCGDGWRLEVVSSITGERETFGPFRASGLLVRLDANQ